MTNLLRILILSVTFLSASAHAQIWQTANVLQQGAATIGGNGQLYFDPSEFTFNGQLLYGIGNQLQLEARLGAGSLDFYAGAFVKYHFFGNKIFDLALWSGLHSQGNAYWDIAPIFSHDFGTVDLYFAPYIAISLGDRETGVTLNPGLIFDVKSDLKVYGELGLEVSNIPTSLAVGIRYFF